jgi:hypothetical protein
MHRLMNDIEKIAAMRAGAEAETEMRDFAVISALKGQIKALETERDLAVAKLASEEVTPAMITAAWGVVRDRYPQGKLMGPGPGFVEAIKAALKAR